jgi:FkbM family methyltransferase
VELNGQPSGIGFYRSQLFRRIAQRSPLVLIDAGARGGVAERWAQLQGTTRAIGFEPDEGECRRLNETSEDDQLFLPLALFDRKGTLRLQITRNPACSSILEPNHELVGRFLEAEDFEITASIEVPCDSLDGVLRTTDVKDVDFLKLDTQGSELRILEGAENVLSDFCVFGVEVEVEFSPLYRGQPLFAEVDGFLRERGFTLFDIEWPLGRKFRRTVPGDSTTNLRGQGLWTCGLYFRDLVSEKGGGLEKLTLEKAAKTIAIAELHGFNDFALELLDLYLSREIISSSFHGDVRGMLLTRRTSVSPERRLYLNLRRSVGEFLRERFPSVYDSLVKRLSRWRAE